MHLYIHIEKLHNHPSSPLISRLGRGAFCVARCAAGFESAAAVRRRCVRYHRHRLCSRLPSCLESWPCSLSLILPFPRVVHGTVVKRLVSFSS